MDPTRQLVTRLRQSGGMTLQKLRRLRARRWKYPLSIERRYTAAISRYLKKQWEDYAFIATRMMVPREDALEDLEPLPGTTGPALGGIVSIAESMEAFNRREIEAFRKIAVGEAFQEDEPWVAGVLRDWEQEQVSLITKASQDMRDAVARRVRDGVKRGLTGKEISRMVQSEMPGISFRRARMIARDQASKLNASLTQGRMSDAGLSTYVWDTAQDERVRGNPGGIYARALPSHWAMQGLVCRWDDPTVCLDANGEWVKRPADAPYLHPGQAIMCRCVALPNWDELESVGDSGLPEAGAAPMEATVEPAAQEEPAVDTGIFSTARDFTSSLESRFETVKKFARNWLGDAYDRFMRLPGYVRSQYSGTFMGYITGIGRSTKASFARGSREILVPGRFEKAKNIMDASVLVHEAGHALDHRLGARYGSIFASHNRFQAFGNRNLATIIREELVDPMLESAASERPDTLKSMLKAIPAEARAALGKYLDSKGGYGYSLEMASIIHHGSGEEGKAIARMLRETVAPADVWKALATGDMGSVSDYILKTFERDTRYSDTHKILVDRRTPTFSKFRQDVMDAGDKEAIYGGISDMFEAATHVPGTFGEYGHGGAAYWLRGPERASTEAFAEILEMLGSPSPRAAYILDKYLPTARDLVLHIIKEGE